MKKKLVIVLSLAMMLVAMLTGCNKTPTAEELVLKSVGEIKDVADMNLLMTVGMGITAEGMTAEMKLIMDANVKSTKEVSYMQGKMTMNLLGMEVSENIETWSDVASGMTYTYNSIYDCWISQTVEVPEISVEDGAKVGAEIFSELLMKEVADEDTEYVVTTKVNLADVYSLIGNSVEEILEAAESVDLSQMNMDVTFVFDRETEKLKSLSMSADEASLAQLTAEGTECTILEIKAEYNEVESEFVLEIPENVKEEAVSGDEMMQLLEGFL